jgi:hypothetical protein
MEKNSYRISNIEYSILEFDQIQILLLLHVSRVQIPGRAGIASNAAMHFTAVDLERQEQILIGRVGIDTELGQITKKTLAGVAGPMRYGVFSLLDQILQLVASQFCHVSVSFA